MMFDLWPVYSGERFRALLFVFVLLVLLLLFAVVLSGEPKQNHGRGLVDRQLVQAPPTPPNSPSILLLAVPRRLFCFGALVILDMVCRYL